MVEYTAATTDATNSINATPEDSASTVELYLNGASTTSPVTWVVGENTLEIRVKGSAGGKTYTVKVTKS